MNEKWFRDNKESIIGIVALVLIIAATGGWYFYQHSHRMAPAYYPNPFSGQGSVEAEKTQAALLMQFPPDLILDKATTPYFSAAIETSSGLRLTKVFTSQLTVDVLAKRYQTTLVAAGWQTQAPPPMTNGTALIFTRETSSLNVTITAEGIGSKFTLTYYPHLTIFDKK